MPPETNTNVDTMDQAYPTRTSLINKRVIILISVIGILVTGGVIAGVILLLRADAATAEKIRDIFIIFMAFEFILIGAALVILAIQLAVLINLLQNEIKPILDTTNEAISTIRGTANFLSGNLVEPVIKLNEYVAALRKIVSFFRLPWRG
jgi:amino acid permease